MVIKDSVFLITGGSAGLGKAMATFLTQMGGKVAITGRDEQKLKSAAQEMDALPVHADVSKATDVDKTFDAVLNHYGRLDCLINNAGIGGWSEIDELDIDKMKEVYAVNVFGAAMMAKRAAQIFKKQGSGNIVNIASTAGTKGYAKGTIYASSKFALRGMTQCWQAELRPYNIRVILVNPSEVPTAFGNPDREERPLEPNKLTPAEIAHTVVSALAMDNRGMIPEVTVWAANPFDSK